MATPHGDIPSSVRANLHGFRKHATGDTNNEKAGTSTRVNERSASDTNDVEGTEDVGNEDNDEASTAVESERTFQAVRRADNRPDTKRNGGDEAQDERSQIARTSTADMIVGEVRHDTSKYRAEFAVNPQASSWMHHVDVSVSTTANDSVRQTSSRMPALSPEKSQRKPREVVQGPTGQKPLLDADMVLLNIATNTHAYYIGISDALIDMAGRTSCGPPMPKELERDIMREGNSLWLIRLLKALIVGLNRYHPRPNDKLETLSHTEWKALVGNAKEKLQDTLVDSCGNLSRHGERQARLLLAEIVFVQMHGYHEDVYGRDSTQLIKFRADPETWNLAFLQRFHMVEAAIANSTIIGAAVMNGTFHEQIALAPKYFLEQWYIQHSNSSSREAKTRARRAQGVALTEHALPAVPATPPSRGGLSNSARPTLAPAARFDVLNQDPMARARSTPASNGPPPSHNALPAPGPSQPARPNTSTWPSSSSTYTTFQKRTRDETCARVLKGLSSYVEPSTLDLGRPSGPIAAQQLARLEGERGKKFPYDAMPIGLMAEYGKGTYSVESYVPED